MKSGVNGLPFVDVRHPSGASLQVYLHGAHAVSWKNSAGRELLFTSAESVFKPGFPIRGGIPVIFPQFGDGPLPKHGLARINEWTFCGSGTNAAGAVEAGFALTDNPSTLELWPHCFRLELYFRLAAMELAIVFSVGNTGPDEFTFHNGLHTYFALADISRAGVSGLQGAEFIDFVGTRKPERETRGLIAFDRETDRVYPMAPDKVELNDEGNGRRMEINKSGMNDLVIWNPWIEKSRRMEDFGNEEYKKMLCVETGNLRSPVRLAPGAVRESATILRCMDS